MNARLIAVLAVVIAVAALAFTPPADDQSWEYKFVRTSGWSTVEGDRQQVGITTTAEAVANEHARQGWVLDQVSTVTADHKNTQMYLVFRRPVRAGG